MRIVADTGPLIALAGIDRLELLGELYGDVLVPDAVHEEVLAGGSYGVGLASYRRSGVRVEPVGRIEPSLAALLDKGEAAVITLALAQTIDQLLIDEQKARKVARSIYGLRVFGSVRVLLDAKRQGLIGNLRVALEEMKDNGYYLHETIV